MLVILAILAAILVPALLGWIDNAKEKQYVLEARNVYMATQAAIDEVYAKGTAIPTNAATDKIAASGTYADMYTRIQSLSDATFTDIQITSYGTQGDNKTAAPSGADITGMIITGLRPNGLTAKTLTLDSTGWKVS